MRHKQIFVSFVCGAWLFSFFAHEFLFTKNAASEISVILPFTGLLIGNSLSGISLGISEWNRAIVRQSGWIETRLAHGATCWEASHPVFKQAMMTAMTPIINSMSVSGIVSLPGMMTGQLLAGADPLKAVEYQIVAMFLIAASTLFGSLVAIGLGFKRKFNQVHQLVLIQHSECR